MLFLMFGYFQKEISLFLSYVVYRSDFSNKKLILFGIISVVVDIRNVAVVVDRCYHIIRI
jgi:hypothetical protein